MVYGPMLDIFSSRSKQLRPYYEFMSVDAVRYAIDGRKQMFVSAVRELPSLGIPRTQGMAAHWGSAALMYTHGFGLVMSPGE